ncbi:LysR substrate-binding domain-containing protein [Vibrio metoecus]|uniref:LysR substrate-binding domain-containing protein n=1 Tax=Vibrio metoecus TaxID=1481663 RepID=UPI00215BC975|nr:LysR substrate-binding domain-containing protein [Vibrio metoecus]MCR9385962.1 LysR substrate-binding domain-containing protein [Vibrio metoecus]
MALKINQLRTISMIAKCGSIRGASRFLGVSQPALTKTLRDLENSLGTQVVIRGSQGVTLTPIGEQLLFHANLILREMDIAEEYIKQILGQHEGTINIGIGASVACELMPQVIRKFRMKYPHVRIKIQEGQLEMHIEQLRQGKLDFAINTVQSDLDLHEFTKEKVIEMPFKLMARKGHPKLKEQNLEALLTCDWIMPTTGISFLNIINELLSMKGKRLMHSITCESYLSELSIISQTDCIGLVSSAAIEHYTYASKLAEIVLDPPLPLATYYLVCRKSSQLTPLASELAKLFKYQSRPLFTGINQTVADSNSSMNNDNKG